MEEIAAKLETEGHCSLKNLRPVGGAGYYVIYMRIGGVGAFLMFDTKRWSELCVSPLWLRIEGWDFKDKTLPREALSDYLVGDLPRAILHRDEFLIPIRVRLGVEKDAVVEHAVRQLSEVYARLKHLKIDDTIIQ